MSIEYNLMLKQRGDEILRRIKDVSHPVVVELGVATGNLSSYLLSMRVDLTLIMVDSWLDKDCQPEAYKATGDSNAHHSQDEQDRRAQLVMNRMAQYGARASIIRMTTIEALEEIEDESIDLVFIDADHSVLGCLADIESYIHKVKFGGWIGGHDYENNDPRFDFGVTMAVDKWSKGRDDNLENDREIQLGENFTWWHLKNAD